MGKVVKMQGILDWNITYTAYEKKHGWSEICSANMRLFYTHQIALRMRRIKSHPSVPGQSRTPSNFTTLEMGVKFLYVACPSVKEIRDLISLYPAAYSTLLEVMVMVEHSFFVGW